MTALSSGQIPLPIELFREPDRNFEKGGRSFYFFDFDDNVIHLATKIVLFHKRDDSEAQVSTTDWPHVHHLVGRPGSEWADYELRDEGHLGSFRNFREIPVELLGNQPQPLIRDMLDALSQPFLDWRGPSWDFFTHAVNNNRPVSIITARGNHPHTIRRAINILRNSRDLGACPNYVSLYPVSNPDIRRVLGDRDLKWTTAQLKKAAIHAAVKDAFDCYGYNPHHRFGMSDDDPLNVKLIIEAMQELKVTYPQNAFFVINTHGRQLTKQEIARQEIIVEGVTKQNIGPDQMELFKV